MNPHARRGDLAGPILLMAFGALILLINLGRLSVSLWSALAQMWPLALIVIGLDLLIPRRSVLASILVAALLVAVVLAGAALALPTLSSPPQVVAGEEVSVPATSDTVAQVALAAGAGRIRVEAEAGDEFLVSGEISLPGGHVEQLVEDLGSTTTVLLKSTGVVILPISFGQGELWDIAVSPDPTLALSTEMGAGEIRIDASGLNLESLKAAAGAGDVQVVVPSGTRSVTLSAAVGQLGIRVPQGAAVRLEASTLAGNVQVPDGYRKVGSAYLSPGFADQGAIEIDASLVFGTIILTEE